MIESAAGRRRGRGSPGVETVAATTDSALARAPRTLSARADDACPTCLTPLDPDRYCNCCGRVIV